MRGPGVFQGLKKRRVMGLRGVTWNSHPERLRLVVATLQPLWAVRVAFVETDYSDAVEALSFNLPQCPLSPTAACQQQMCLVDMCSVANKKY